MSSLARPTTSDVVHGWLGNGRGSEQSGIRASQCWYQWFKSGSMDASAVG